MNIIFSTSGWEDYLYFLEKDKRILKRINDLIRDIKRNPKEAGIGKTEKLSHQLSGFSSRRINQEHRIVYRIKEDSIEIVQLRNHY
jgi:toxin YoeB